MAEGFDFAFLQEGEIIVDEINHDIMTVEDDELRIQLAYDRMKSISHDWFVDEIGADLEELIGKHCTQEIVEYGKNKIISVLVFDGLWSMDDIVVIGKINNNVNIQYSVYLKLYQDANEDPWAYELTAEIDLVKGVFVKYGWMPKRRGWFKGVQYKKEVSGLESIKH